MPKEVRSPLSTEGNIGRDASRPVGQGPLGRADQGYGGHAARHVGKAGPTPPPLTRRDQSQAAEPRVELRGNPEFRITPPVQRPDSRRR
jgi:hypothetical protein